MEPPSTCTVHDLDNLLTTSRPRVGSGIQTRTERKSNEQGQEKHPALRDLDVISDAGAGAKSVKITVKSRCGNPEAGLQAKSITAKVG